MPLLRSFYSFVYDVLVFHGMRDGYEERLYIIVRARGRYLKYGLFHDQKQSLRSFLPTYLAPPNFPFDSKKSPLIQYLWYTPASASTIRPSKLSHLGLEPRLASAPFLSPHAIECISTFKNPSFPREQRICFKV